MRVQTKNVLNESLAKNPVVLNKDPGVSWALKNKVEGENAALFLGCCDKGSFGYICFGGEIYDIN
jgi:hypothetical protein